MITESRKVIYLNYIKMPLAKIMENEEQSRGFFMLKAFEDLSDIFKINIFLHVINYS